VIILRFKLKRNVSVVIILILTLFAFVDSAIYYYPSYAYKGIDRDFYLSKDYYLIYVVGRGLLYGALLNGVYFIIYFIMKVFVRKRPSQTKKS
jgi:hypothetical protein